MKLRYWNSFILVLVIMMLGTTSKVFAQNCSDGLSTIDQVTVRVACRDSFTISWPFSASNCYKVTVGTGVNEVQAKGSLTVPKNGPGIISLSKITITESCGANPCNSTTSVDTFMAVVPPLDSAGLWSFQNSSMTGSGTMMTVAGRGAFTASSPTNVPDLSTEANISATTTRIVRPTCMMDSNGVFDIQFNFAADMLDSIIYQTIRNSDSLLIQCSKPAESVSKTQTSFVAKVTGSGNKIPAGSYTTKLLAFGGSCFDSVTVITVVGEGSNEPVVACNSDLNLSVDAACMVDIHVGMILAGQNSPCVNSLMDSLVVKTQNGKILQSYIVPSRYDTVRIPNASDYIKKPLIIEVHSSGGGVSNTCWGNLLLEDKIAPVLVCDTSYVERCFDFDETDMSHIKVTDCDKNPKINLINLQRITDCKELPDSIVKRFIRVYNAVDNFNNISNTCSDTVNIRRLDHDLKNDTLDIEGFKRPFNYVVNPRLANDTSAFICDKKLPFADLDNNGVPDPLEFIVVNGKDTLYGAGVPKIDTIIGGDTLKAQFFPSNFILPDSSVAKIFETCKAITTYRDVILPSIGCVRKVIRTWTISEYVCNKQRTLEFTQTIEIQDSTGPVIVIPPNMKVSTNRNNCTRQMIIPSLIDIMDNCSVDSTYHVTVKVKNGIYIGALNSSDGTYSSLTGGILELPTGLDTVIYTAFDQCHNSTSDTMIIEVVDETTPVMICKEFVSVALTNDVGTTMHASSIDNGSFDDCSMNSLCVVRMIDQNSFDQLRARNVGGTLSSGVAYVPLDSIIGQCGRKFAKSGTINGFDYIIKADLCTPNVEFCCADGSVQDTVILRGTDKRGNKNECMVLVEVQDKRRPLMHCPPNLTIDCNYAIPQKDNYAIFGNVVAQGQQKVLNIPDSVILKFQNGKSLTDGVWTGNCAGEVSVLAIKEVDKCSAGAIKRTFTLKANGQSTTCVQTISINRSDTVDIATIKFPRDTSIIGCGLPSDVGIDVLGRPYVPTEACTLLGDAHEDLVVRKNDPSGDACFKIIREWSIIDWCANPAKVVATRKQIIKMIDNVAPVLLNNECRDTIYQVSTCDDSKVTLQNRGIDLCTDSQNLKWRVEIDLDNDGDIDQSHNISPSVDNGQSVASLTRSLPHGSHRAVWILSDRCGNSQVCEQAFSIVNNITPAVICKTSLTGSFMPTSDSTASLEVWAEEYKASQVTHLCGYQLIYSFSPKSLEPSKRFTCADYKPSNESNSTIIAVDVYVLTVIISHKNGKKDTSILNSSKCSSNFVLHDTQNICSTSEGIQGGTSNNFLVTGNISTSNGQNIPSVDVSLDGVLQGASTIGTSTDENGMYAFSAMEEGKSYHIKPKLNHNILNGVSTLDLVLIQKHILGLENLDSPYKFIAADVNNDRNISAIDLIELRKVILNVSETFTNNTSWRFVDASFNFDKRKNPLSQEFPEQQKIDALESNMVVDFIGIKTGDVNDNVEMSDIFADSRSKVYLSIEDKEFQTGEIIEMPISLSRKSKVVGLQYAIQFDPSILKFNGYHSDLITLSSSNFGLADIDEGTIYVSWDEQNGIEIDEESLMTLSFKSKNTGVLSDVLSLSNHILASEIYSQDLEVSSLALEFKQSKKIGKDEFELFQNLPNPFHGSTEVSFSLPRQEEGTLRFYNIEGKLLKQVNGSFEKGINKLTISKGELGVSSGVVIYTLEVGDLAATKEMILIE